MTRLSRLVLLLATGCSSSPPGPAPTASATGAPVSPSTKAASTSAPQPSAAASGSTSATGSPAPADACASLASWSPWAGKQPRQCKLLIPPDPSALPPLIWSSCASDLGIAGCRQVQRVESRVDAARGTAAVRVTCQGPSGNSYVEVAEIDGKPLAAIGATGGDLGDCPLTLLDHRDGHWLVGAQGQPLSQGKAGAVPVQPLQSILLGGPVAGKVGRLWAGESEDWVLRAAFGDARGYAFDFGDMDSERWSGASWRGEVGSVMGTPLPRRDEMGVAFGQGGLFVAASQRGLFVVDQDTPEEPLVPDNVKVSGVAADGRDLVFRAVRERRCRLFASPIARKREAFAPRRIAEGCDEPVVVGCGHTLVRAQDRVTLIRLRDGAAATLQAPRLGDPIALSCKEAFFTRSWHLLRVPLASFGNLAPPTSPVVAADPDDLFEARADAGDDAGPAADAGMAAGDAGATGALTDAGADSGATLGDVDKRPRPALGHEP